MLLSCSHKQFFYQNPSIRKLPFIFCVALLESHDMDEASVPVDKQNLNSYFYMYLHHPSTSKE